MPKKTHVRHSRQQPNRKPFRWQLRPWNGCTPLNCVRQLDKAEQIIVEGEEDIESEKPRSASIGHHGGRLVRGQLP
jgi:hypothetical protein